MVTKLTSDRYTANFLTDDEDGDRMTILSVRVQQQLLDKLEEYLEDRWEGQSSILRRACKHYIDCGCDMEAPVEGETAAMLTFRVTPTIEAWLSQRADQLHLSRSAVIRRGLRNFLEDNISN